MNNAKIPEFATDWWYFTAADNPSKRSRSKISSHRLVQTFRNALLSYRRNSAREGGGDGEHACH
jgi:hypothetical protein